MPPSRTVAPYSQPGRPLASRRPLGHERHPRPFIPVTNPCESMIETVRRVARNVKRWQSGDMCLRWTAAGMLEAERQFRRVIGHPDLGKLAVAVERDLTARRVPHTTATEAD